MSKTIQFDETDGRHFIEVYMIEDRWAVDEFIIRPKQLQDRLSHRIFDYESDAFRYANQIRGRAFLSGTKISLVQTETARPLWPVKQEWNQEWEEKYAEWVEANIDKDFFVKHQISTDCADVAYGLRWIFARIHSLPIGASLAGSGIVFTNLSSRKEWDKLPTHQDWSKDKRFLAALNWIFNNTFTDTLATDSYPLKVSSDSIMAGTINFLGGHTEIVSRINPTGKDVPISFISSTLPKEIRQLLTRAFTSSFAEPEGQGFVQFRWLANVAGKWKLIAKEKMPHYSLEQYSKELCPDIEHFARCVYKKLHLEFIPQDVIEAQLQSLIETINLRKQIVTDGFKNCQSIDCSPGSEGWEQWNTPSRDKRLLKAYKDGKELVNDLSGLDPNLKKYWENALGNTVIRNIGGELLLKDFFWRLDHHLTSIDPRDPIEARWASNQSGISTTVTNFFKRVRPTREKALHDSIQCIGNLKKCGPETEIYKTTNTVKLDEVLIRIYRGYKLYCEEHVCENRNLTKDIQWILFANSSPWHSTESRRGAVHGSPIIITGEEKVQEIGSWLIVGNKMRQLPDGEFVTVPEDASLFGIRSWNKIFAIDKHKIWIWDGNSFHFFADVPKWFKSFSFTNDFLVVDYYNGTLLINKRGELVRDFHKTDCSDDGSSNFIFRNEENILTLLVMSEEGFNKIPLPDQNVTWNIIGQDHGRVFLTATKIEEAHSKTLYVLDGSKFKRYFDIPLDNFRMWEGFFIASDYENIMIFRLKDMAKLKEYTGDSFSVLKMRVPVISISNDRDGSGSVILLGNPDNLREMKFKGHNIYLHPDWFSVTDYETAQIQFIDYEGQKLHSAFPFERYRALSNDTRVAVMGWSSLVDDEEVEVSEIGHYGNLASTSSPWAQRLWIENETNYSSAPISVLPNSTFVDKGVLFEVADGLRLFWPKGRY